MPPEAQGPVVLVLAVSRLDRAVLAPVELGRVELGRVARDPAALDREEWALGDSRGVLRQGEPAGFPEELQGGSRGRFPGGPRELRGARLRMVREVFRVRHLREEASRVPSRVVLRMVRFPVERGQAEMVPVRSRGTVLPERQGLSPVELRMGPCLPMAQCRGEQAVRADCRPLGPEPRPAVRALVDFPGGREAFRRHPRQVVCRAMPWRRAVARQGALPVACPVRWDQWAGRWVECPGAVPPLGHPPLPPCLSFPQDRNCSRSNSVANAIVSCRPISPRETSARTVASSSTSMTPMGKRLPASGVLPVLPGVARSRWGSA